MTRTLARLALISSVSVACAPTQPSATATGPCVNPQPIASATPTPPAPPTTSSVAVQEPSAPQEAQAATVASILVSNLTPIARRSETVVVARAEIEKLVPNFDFKKAAVVDDQGRPVLSQIVDMTGDGVVDELVFQSDLAASESRTYKLRLGQRKLAARADYKAYGRFVRERHDDFAWENDLAAYRMYGPDLETTAKEPLISSGIDTWVKRVPKLVINDWYMTDDYHQDSGEGADFYGVGKSRGCGGLGIWDGKKLVTSKNFTTSRVLANGPIRLVFELSYAPWEVAKGVRVGETKRVILDAGSHFNRFESTFIGNGRKELAIGIGISKHAGSTVQPDAASASMRTWEPLRGPKGDAAGNLGCAVVLPAGSRVEEHHGEAEYLAVTPLPSSGRLVFYAGSAWDQAGQIRDAAAWGVEVQNLSTRLAAPVVIKLSGAN